MCTYVKFYENLTLYILFQKKEANDMAKEYATNSPKYEKVDELTREIKSRYVTLDATTKVVSNYLGRPTTWAGRRPKWLCPFHNEKTPSFSVNPKNGKCGCYSCNVFFSNAIDFVIEYEGLLYEEAVFVAGDILGLDTGIDVSQIERKERKPVEVSLPKTTDRKEVDVRKLNLAHRIFLDTCRDENGNLVLSEEHRNELKSRDYTDEQIKSSMFFTFPQKKHIGKIVAKIEEMGLKPATVLSYVPGFSFNRKTGEWEMMELKCPAYGLPIPDENGNIIAIQLRLTANNMPKKGSKYIWFSSPYAMNTLESSEPQILGNSPAAPLGVILPQSGKAKRLLITEGYHKAYAVVNRLKNTSYAAITAQGVNNTKGIVKVAAAVSKKVGCGFLDIAFDGDMAMKETVLKPALKLGLNMSGLSFPEDHKNAIISILNSGNKDEKTVASAYKSIAKDISTYLRNNEKNMWFAEIGFLMWENEEEKGIDDLIQAGKETSIRRMNLADFFDLAFEYLAEIEDIRLNMAKEQGKMFREVDISKEEKNAIFVKVANSSEKIA